MKTNHLLSAFLTLSIIVSSPVTTGSGKSDPPASIPSTASTVAPTDTDSSGQRVAVYAVQFGAFSVQENAERLVSLLKSKGIDAIIYDNLIDGKRLLYLVWVGRFDRAEDAILEIRRVEELTGIRGVLREQMIWRRK